MSDVRIKTIYKDDKQINDFLSLKDIEFVDMEIGSMECVILYKKIKKQKGRPPNVK